MFACIILVGLFMCSGANYVRLDRAITQYKPQNTEEIIRSHPLFSQRVDDYQSDGHECKQLKLSAKQLSELKNIIDNTDFACSWMIFNLPLTKSMNSSLNLQLAHKLRQFAHKNGIRFFTDSFTTKPNKTLLDRRFDCCQKAVDLANDKDNHDLDRYTQYIIVENGKVELGPLVDYAQVNLHFCVDRLIRFGYDVSDKEFLEHIQLTRNTFGQSKKKILRECLNSN